MYDVFISYASEDFEMANRIYNHLQRHLKDIFFDKKRIKPGATIGATIDSAIEGSKYVLLLISPSYMAKDYCRFEAMRAQFLSDRGKIKVIQVWHNVEKHDVAASFPNLGLPKEAAIKSSGDFNLMMKSVLETVRPLNISPEFKNLFDKIERMYKEWHRKALAPNTSAHEIMKGLGTCRAGLQQLLERAEKEKISDFYYVHQQQNISRYTEEITRAIENKRFKEQLSDTPTGFQVLGDLAVLFDQKLESIGQKPFAKSLVKGLLRIFGLLTGKPQLGMEEYKLLSSPKH